MCMFLYSARFIAQLILRRLRDAISNEAMFTTALGSRQLYGSPEDGFVLFN